MCEECIEHHIVAVDSAVGDRDRENEGGELCGTVAVSRTDVARPKGGVPRDVALVACDVVPGKVAIEESNPPGRARCQGNGTPILDGGYQVRTEQGATVANEVCGNSGVVRMKFP